MQNNVKILSNSDYFETIIYAYVGDERIFLVCKTKEIFVSIVKLLCFKNFDSTK